MEIRTATGADLESMVRLAAEAQVHPDQHIGYLGSSVESIRADVVGVEGWADRTIVMVDRGRSVAGWLLADPSPDLDRVWWWGPFLAADASDAAADALYELASRSVGAGEEEMAPDDRNLRVAQLARRHGFVAEEASAVLSYTGRGFGGGGGTVALDESHREQVARLHDQLFPGTHTPGRALAQGDDPRLVALDEGTVTGYVAVEVHADRTGYIDYLGVHPAWRRRGVGRRLVADATDLLIARGADSVHLTVREGNYAARAMYQSLGFTHERVIRPFRKGFTLAGGSGSVDPQDTA